MVTKHVPALTAESAALSAGSDESQSNGVGQLRQICNAVGPAFVHRLLRTQGDSAAAVKSGGGGVSGLSVYQMIALGVLAAFFQDESLVSPLKWQALAWYSQPQTRSTVGLYDVHRRPETRDDNLVLYYVNTCTLYV